MKIAILSRNPKLYSTYRLVEAGQQRGHEVVVLDTLKCYMDIASTGSGIHYKGERVEGFDAVIPRIGASIKRTGTAWQPTACSSAIWFCHATWPERNRLSVF